MIRGIGIVNQSPAVNWGDLVRAGVACELQLARDFGPLWGLDLRTVVVSVRAKDTNVPPDWLLVVVLPNPDVANALGYHSETPDGRKYARVFTDGQMLADIERTLSHEILEAVADDACNRWAQSADGSLYALEVCDPVQGDAYSVDLSDTNTPVVVSNFVGPDWFDANPSAKARFDFMGKLSAPFTMSPGGYVITMAGGATTELDANKLHPASRTARRGLACGE